MYQYRSRQKKVWRDRIAQWLACWAILPVAACAAPTPAQYAQALALSADNASRVDREPSAPVWIDPTHFVYRRGLARPGQPPALEYRVVDTESAANSLAFDHARLAAAMALVSAKPVDAAALKLEQLQLSGQQLRFVREEAGWQCDLTRYRCERDFSRDIPPESRDMALPLKQGPAEAERSPDGRWRAWVNASGDVLVTSSSGGSPIRLSRDGSRHAYYALDSVAWSPDSSQLVAYRVTPPPPRIVYYIESAPADQLQPKLHQQVYPKPGDPLPLVQPVLFDLATRTAHPIASNLFPNPFQLGMSRWWKDGRGFTFEYNERGHQRYRVIEVDRHTAQARVLIEETSPTFIDYAELNGLQESSGKYARKDLADGNQILWASERDGWEHLYLYDGRKGSFVRQVTRGPWVVRSIDRVDEAAGQVYFSASGMHGEEDPYFRHAYRIGLDGHGLTELTAAPSDHEISYSPDGRLFLDLFSRVDEAPVLALRRSADGALVHVVETTDLTRLRAAGWRPPEVFHAPGRDGKTEIWGVIFPPRQLDPQQHYRVLEDIYAGPQGSFVPKRFDAYTPALTALGFAVAMIDGMGTNNRSRAFHDLAWRNLKDAGFADRIAWHRAAAAHYPWYDLSGGVGIYGTSAGGQNALGALLFHPEFYVAAVANSGCHDNRMDKMWWNEQWMGWPVGSWYSASSNVDNAWRLQGHLLLVTGDMDQNVDPASTFQVADRLIKANKDFELLVVPGGDHGAGGEYGKRRLLDFFVRWMQRTPTPEWNRIARDQAGLGE